MRCLPAGGVPLIGMRSLRPDAGWLAVAGQHLDLVAQRKEPVTDAGDYLLEAGVGVGGVARTARDDGHPASLRWADGFTPHRYPRPDRTRTRPAGRYDPDPRARRGRPFHGQA